MKVFLFLCITSLLLFSALRPTKAGSTDVPPDLHTGSAKYTYYNVSVGLGACGLLNNDQDFTVALNEAQFGSGYPGPHCFEKISISYGGKETEAVIMDMCPGCPSEGLDLSPGLFGFFGDLGTGVIHGSWSFTGKKWSEGEQLPGPSNIESSASSNISTASSSTVRSTSTEGTTTSMHQSAATGICTCQT